MPMIHNQLTDYLTDMGLPRLDDIATKDGFQLPCYTLSGFINTLEGHNLMAECLEAGDLKPYYAAKEIYDRRQTREATP